MSKANILFSTQSSMGHGKPLRSTGNIRIEIDNHDPCPDYIDIDSVDISKGTTFVKKDKSIIIVHSCDGRKWTGTFGDLIDILCINHVSIERLNNRIISMRSALDDIKQYIEVDAPKGTTYIMEVIDNVFEGLAVLKLI